MKTKNQKHIKQKKEIVKKKEEERWQERKERRNLAKKQLARRTETDANIIFPLNM